MKWLHTPTFALTACRAPQFATIHWPTTRRRDSDAVCTKGGCRLRTTGFAAHKGEKVVMLLITDGEPNCNSSVDGVVTVAQNAYKALFDPTYVVGVGPQAQNGGSIENLRSPALAA